MAAQDDTRPTLLFVSPQFLFPLDAGGKIRTTNILRNMKGGAFRIHLISPATPDEETSWGAEVTGICDEYTPWRIAPRDRLHRFAGLLSPLPVSVWSDALPESRRAVETVLKTRPDVAVFDFTHCAALMPSYSFMEKCGARTVLFTHNVETEIFARHARTSSFPMSIVWQMERAKMARFERNACSRFDTVIAVSERDAAKLKEDFGTARTAAIPTGVDLDFFGYTSPTDETGSLIFTGSMDWRANQDGLMWFLNEVWPLIAEKRPQTSFKVIGKNPPQHLIDAAQNAGANWTFTGFVDDIRPHAAEGSAYVIPLRVGGGTRIKAYEAMAMGLPVVSTALGVEGLPLSPGEHYLKADTPEDFAAATLRLLAETDTRRMLSMAARDYVEKNCSQKSVAEVFERICLDTLNAG
ncbi:glycosyltransferase [Parvularcula flava]|uniref:Glycosyl transferase family 1 n=1 Tax=Aquisalinus luteolus TaxID=1566827 RepID=A0A8J3A419_9PROT|nr:glycosyltransferase family 4 protein [Aquisalinus luteolus]NHK28039.1 glycosyltransferase [Aquisalinus luteolus]GGH97280.1 glycosyl transferase family 1 [Aquisalinus luteolus]